MDIVIDVHQISNPNYWYRLLGHKHFWFCWLKALELKPAYTGLHLITHKYENKLITMSHVYVVVLNQFLEIQTVNTKNSVPLKVTPRRCRTTKTQSGHWLFANFQSFCRAENSGRMLLHDPLIFGSKRWHWGSDLKFPYPWKLTAGT